MHLDASMRFVVSAISIEGIKAGSILVGSKAYQTMLLASNIAIKFFKVYALYSMYESALSDIFCLKTFRHGTNPYAAIRILLTGLDLRRAGIDGEARFFRMAFGMDSPWASRDQQRQAFYVVGDDYQNRNAFLDYIITKSVAKYYAMASTAAFFSALIPFPQRWKGKVTKLMLMNPLLNLLSPMVKLHINPNRIGRDLTFHQDAMGGGLGALYTYDKFSALDMGVLGVLKNGINTDLPRRMWENKRQVLWGVAQLVVAVVFTVCLFPTLVPGSWVTVSSVVSMIASQSMALEKFGQLGAGLRAVVVAPSLLYAGLQV